MPTLPDVNSFSQAAPQPASGVAGYEPPNWRQVGMAGQEISGAGRNIEQAADTIAQTNERQDAIVAQSAANSLRQAAITLQYDPTQGFASVKEGGTVGQQFVSDYTDKLNQAATQIRGNLLTGDQQRIFDQHAQVVGLQYQQALLEHQARQTDAFNDSTTNDTVTLALRSMAQRPLDEVNFQTQLLAINKTLEDAGSRKGMPPQAVAALKGQFFDTVYGTRIQAIASGIPGVVQANPYLAEKMFDQVQDQLGPNAQIGLARDVQNAIRPVQQRDVAQKIVNGQLPTSPDVLWHVTAGSAPMAAIVQRMESGGDENAVSPKGAQGAMQVMPTTSTDPGFGVQPAQLGADGKPLPGELDRVGRDYLGAMTARYDNPALVLAAYNAGPGQVDKWIAQNGDPRTGQISTADWASKIPFSETQKYVANGLQQLGDAHAAVAGADVAKTNPAQFAGTTGADGALPPVSQVAQPQAPTANDLKTRLPSMMSAARDSWLSMYPNDIVGADGAATRVASYAQLTIGAQQAQQESARDALTRGLVGAAPDGSQRATTMDQLLADPTMKAAWNAATPEVQMAIQDRMKLGGDPPRTAATQTLLYQLKGQYANDRSGFAALDLTPLVSKLPFADFDAISNLQMAARNKADLDADRSNNMIHALALAKDYALLPAHIPMPDKNTSPDSVVSKNFNAFTGALGQELDQFQAKNGRRANDQEVITMAKGLTTSVQTPGNWWGTNSAPAFLTPADARVIVPAGARAGIVSAFQGQGTANPSEAQIQTAYVQHLISAPGTRRSASTDSAAATPDMSAMPAQTASPPPAALPAAPPASAAASAAPAAPSPADSPAAAFARSRARMDAISAQRDAADAAAKKAADDEAAKWVDVPAGVGATTRRVRKN